MAGHANLGRVHQAGQRAVRPTADRDELTDDAGHVAGLIDQVAFVRGAHMAVGAGELDRGDDVSRAGPLVQQEAVAAIALPVAGGEHDQREQAAREFAGRSRRGNDRVPDHGRDDPRAQPRVRPVDDRERLLGDAVAAELPDRQPHGRTGAGRGAPGRGARSRGAGRAGRVPGTGAAGPGAGGDQDPAGHCGQRGRAQAQAPPASGTRGAGAAARLGRPEGSGSRKQAIRRTGHRIQSAAKERYRRRQS